MLTKPSVDKQIRVPYVSGIMFAIDDKLISDELLDAPFACNLGACHGACCVKGDGGAPLESEERPALRAIMPRVRKYLRPEALKVIKEKGVWEEVGEDEYAIPTVGGDECIFVTYEGPVAKCAIQKAYLNDRIEFPKPISCHLFPVRIEQVGEYEVLNYEQVEICDPARKHGRKHNLQLIDMLQEPLTRKYGEAWYSEFRKVCAARIASLEDAATQ